MEQAQPPTDAEQVQTLRTANAQLRQRVKEQEQIAIELRSELEAAWAVIVCWKRQPPYYDDCDPGQNDPYYAWWAEMNRLTVAYDIAVMKRV